MKLKFAALYLHFLYHLMSYLLYVGLRLAAPFNSKAKKLKKGQMQALKAIQLAFKEQTAPVMWMHCASTGEFEQGRPVLEDFIQTYPHYKILLTFFSPSGYEAYPTVEGVHCVSYLPLDTTSNAKALIAFAQPQIVIWIKYEYWYNTLCALKEAHIRTYLISAIFNKKQIFFRPYSRIFSRVLCCFTRLFVQDYNSVNLLNSIGITSVDCIGDTRFDRVIEITQQKKEYPIIENFIGNATCLILGSSWPKDEQLVRKMWEHIPNVKLIIVPHEVHPQHIDEIQHLFAPFQSLRYSQITTPQDQSLLTSPILIVDTIGMLASIYRYANIAYVGCGFDDGIHNVLEPAVWGVPVIFGPNYKRFREAVDLVELGGAFSISNHQELNDLLQTLMLDNKIDHCGEINKQYIAANLGASTKIMEVISSLRSLV